MRLGLAIFALSLAACATSSALDAGVDASGSCRVASDCAAGTTCVAHACMPSTACTTSRMCPGLVCDSTRGVCVECVTSVDCASGMVCVADVCGPPPSSCTSDRDCSAMGLVCDAPDAICVECNGDADCDPAQFCDPTHACAADLCAAGATTCVGGGIAPCLPNGSGFGFAMPCASGACSGGACVPPMDAGPLDAGPHDAGRDAGDASPILDFGVDAPAIDAGDDASLPDSGGALYHGWTSPLGGCDTSTYTMLAPTNLGGTYPFIAGDTDACRAWKLAATVCTTEPTMYTDMTNWQCPASGGFTDPVFGTYCATPSTQYACSTCPGACNAMCIYHPLSLRNCLGTEANQM